MTDPDGPRVRFGFKTEQPRASYPELLRIWQEVDELPAFADAWLFDHFVPLRLDPDGPCSKGGRSSRPSPSRPGGSESG